MTQALPTDQTVREALRSVNDPELGVSIVDLGLVYRIDVAPARVHVELTMTTPACPMSDLLADNARQAIAAQFPEGIDVDIELVSEPPWTPELMSESAKRTLGWGS